MKRVPKSWPVLGTVYKVYWTKNKRLLNGDNDGCCCPEKKTIYINKELVNGERYTMEVFLHELGHALVFEASISQSLPEGLEEVVVDLFARTNSYLQFGVRPRRGRGGA